MGNRIPTFRGNVVPSTAKVNRSYNNDPHRRNLVGRKDIFFFFVFGTIAHQWATASTFLKFLDHTQRRTTIGRTTLDEWSARRRDLYLTTHNTHNRQTSMTPVGFEPTISAGERPQTHALDRAATGTGKGGQTTLLYFFCLRNSFEYWVEEGRLKKLGWELREKGCMYINPFAPEFFFYFSTFFI